MAAILEHLPQDLNLSDEASKIEEGEVKSNSNTSRISQLKERLNSLQIRQKNNNLRHNNTIVTLKYNHQANGKL